MAGKRAFVFALFTLVALGLAISISSGARAQTYKPQSSYTLVDATAGASSDSTLKFGVPLPDYNYQDVSIAYFYPPDGWTAMAEEMPIGETVGTLDAKVFISQLGTPCNALLSPNFTLRNASTNIADELSVADLDWILTTTPPYDVNPANGIPDYLDRYPFFLNQAFDPDGPSGPKLPLEPRARYAGVTDVANMMVIVQFVLFSPGQLAEMGALTSPPQVWGDMGPELGFASFIVLDNPIGGEPSVSAIGNFCTALTTTTTLLGTTGGSYVRTLNPAAGTGVLLSETHMSRNYNQSERDNVRAAAGEPDGFENDLDPCRWSSDTAAGWNPKVSGAGGTAAGDNDQDNIPNSCDPDVDGDPDDAGLIDCMGDPVDQTDCDDDGYDNTQDNCPLVPNGVGDASEQEGTEPVGAPDLGPSDDAMGDVCDDSDNDGKEDGTGAHTPGTGDCADGVDNDADNAIDGNDPQCVNYMDAGEIDLGNTVAEIWGTDAQQGDYFHGMPWSAVCVGGAGNGPERDAQCADADDDDGDGVVNDGCPALGNAEDPAAGECADALDENTQVPNDEGDAAPDQVNDGCPTVSPTDGDLDGYCDALENTLGSPTANGSEANLTTGTCDPDPGGANPSCCNNALDDDGDLYFNDGCPQVGYWAEVGAECAKNDAVNDDCVAGGGTCAPDAREFLLGAKVNDGCPVIGVPESLVIDTQISAGAGALPAPAVAQSCSDGIDNDNDNKIDAAADNGALACDPASYPTDDADNDGRLDASDNCPSDWNPEQTNTDVTSKPPGDGLGDVCDNDDDNDGYNDDMEWKMGTDPLDHCSNLTGAHDAWPLDINIDKFVTVVGDVLLYRGNVGCSVSNKAAGGWLCRRLDLNGDAFVTVVGDVLLFRGNVGASC